MTPAAATDVSSTVKRAVLGRGPRQPPGRWAALPAGTTKLQKLLETNPEHPDRSWNYKTPPLCKWFWGTKALGVLKFIILGRSGLLKPVLKQSNKDYSCNLGNSVFWRLCRAFSVLQEHEFSLISCIKPWYHVLESTKSCQFSPSSLVSINPFKKSSSNKINPFTVERCNKDDGCFFGVYFRCVHKHSPNSLSQLMRSFGKPTAVYWKYLFFSQVRCREGNIYIWIALSHDHEIHIFVIVNAQTSGAGTLNELLLRNPILVPLGSSAFLWGSSVQLWMLIWNSFFPPTRKDN